MERVSRDEQDSLAPVSIEQATLEEEVARLQTGQAQQLWKWGLAVAALGLVALFTVQGMETAHQRDQALQGVSYLTSTKLESFFNCALPQAAPVRISSRDQLHALLERHSHRDAAALGKQVKRCLADLREYKAGLAELSVPTDVQPQHDALVVAARKLHDRADVLARRLQAEPSMDYVKTTELVDRLTGAHADLRAARREWNTAMAF